MKKRSPYYTETVLLLCYCATGNRKPAVISR